ncbi:MAG: iron-containing redox enzyme family protein [Kineosporiaceae bacterium]
MRADLRLVAAPGPAEPRDRSARLPQARGPLGEAVLEALRASRDGNLDSLARRAAALAHGAAQRWQVLDGETATAVLDDDDLHLALVVLQELHYRGYDGVDDRVEWHPQLVGARTALEGVQESALRVLTGPTVEASLRRIRARAGSTPSAQDVAAELFDLVDADTSPSVSAHLDHLRDHGQLARRVPEFLVHRSIYQLKEADPHSWAIPRLAGRAKAALVEVQSDEYGGGLPERMHSALFAQVMRDLGLDDHYGRYVDAVPAATLASVASLSMFGLHRRLRGAVAGHLAVFEMTSSIPHRRYGNALRRLGAPDSALVFFDEHVEADAVHEQIAARDLAGGLVEDEPQRLTDVLFGAAACLLLDGRWAEHVLEAWGRGRSSLRLPLRRDW